MTAWDGDAYQARFDRLAAGGVVHGEAGFVASLDPAPATVLDAGCGTGRVAVELARRGIAVVGVDVDASMLDRARRSAPDIEWIAHDLTTLDLAGNVPLFTPPGTHADLVAGCARHVAPGGILIAGFQLDRGYTLEAYDGHCVAAGLTLAVRYATWDRAPFGDPGDYAVSVHRRA